MAISALPPKAKITAEVCSGRSRPKLVQAESRLSAGKASCQAMIVADEEADHAPEHGGDHACADHPVRIAGFGLRFGLLDDLSEDVKEGKPGGAEQEDSRETAWPGSLPATVKIKPTKAHKPEATSAIKSENAFHSSRSSDAAMVYPLLQAAPWPTRPLAP